MAGLIWIIDEEWDDYSIEDELLKSSLPEYEVKYSKKNNYINDLETYGKIANAIITQIDIDITNNFIHKLKKCRVISVYGTGYENIDIKAADEKGILVSNVPDFCIHEVSDHIIAFIYHFNKKILSYKEKIKQGLWGIHAVEHLPKRLHGSVLFIIGFGNIGKAVATKASSLGLNIVTFDPFLLDRDLTSYNVKKVAWRKGFQIADYVVVTTRLTKETKEMIGMSEFKMMKNEAVLINTSRGEILKENDLVEAVKTGMIAGAALDVTSQEPPDKDNDLLKNENILITPHVSYLTQESLRELREKTVNNVISTLKDNNPINVVSS